MERRCSVLPPAFGLRQWDRWALRLSSPPRPCLPSFRAPVLMERRGGGSGEIVSFRSNMHCPLIDQLTNGCEGPWPEHGAGPSASSKFSRPRAEMIMLLLVEKYRASGYM